MAASNYPGTTPGDLRNILNQVVSPSERNEILQALRESGVITSPFSDVGLKIVDDPNVFTRINAHQTQVVVLGPDSSTVVHSNGPIVVAASSGDNYIDISVPNPQNDTVIGGSGNDYIFGNSADPLLRGGTGHETIQSGGGHDTIVGGSGFDTLIGGGTSVVYGGSGTARIFAGQFSSSHDTVYAGTGHDTITLQQGNNTVHGPSLLGAATIRAGAGHDTIDGGAGASTIVSGATTTLNLGTGNVNLRLAGSSNDTIFGGANTGALHLNKASTDVTSTTTSNGQTTIAFSGGSSITTVGNVNITFTDHTKKSV